MCGIEFSMLGGLAGSITTPQSWSSAMFREFLGDQGKGEAQENPLRSRAAPETSAEQVR
jgi:hypothetical protein